MQVRRSRGGYFARREFPPSLVKWSICCDRIERGRTSTCSHNCGHGPWKYRLDPALAPQCMDRQHGHVSCSLQRQVLVLPSLVVLVKRAELEPYSQPVGHCLRHFRTFWNVSNLRHGRSDPHYPNIPILLQESRLQKTLILDPDIDHRF